MKKLLIVVILAVVGMTPVFSQDISPIVRDLSAILEGIGEESIPYLEQNALAGEGIGRAAMGGVGQVLYCLFYGDGIYPRPSHLHRRDKLQF